MYKIYKLTLDNLIYDLNVESYVKNFKNRKVEIFRGGLRECKIKMYFEEFTHNFPRNAESCLAYNKLDIFRVYEVYKRGKLYKYIIYFIDKD